MASESARGARPRYRYDLDGLRGLAIALVVGHHVWGSRVSGGVDVFLTLSGFFFALSLTRMPSASSTGAALAQTVRQWRHFAARLLPSAAVVLTATGLLTIWAMPSSRWEETSRQILASLFFVENWHLANSAEAYRTAAPDVAATQHFWSLSIQGQLFAILTVVALLTLLLLRRVSARDPRATLAVLVAAGSVASFAFALQEIGTRQEYAYYDTRARAWEFLVGVTAGLVLPWTASVVGRVPARLRASAAGLAVALLAATAFLVDGARQFPGWATLLPVGAALVLIVVGEQPTDTAPQRVLAWKPMRELGSIAYPLYLWHWPLLVVALEVTGRSSLGLVLGGGLIAFTVALAWATHHGVEQPLRERRSTAGRPVLRRLAVVLLVTSAALPSAAWLVHTDSQLQRVEAVSTEQVTRSRLADPSPSSVVPENLLPAPWLAADDAPGMPRECATLASATEVITCDLGDPTGERTLVVVGGSHMGMWVPALDGIGQDRHLRIVTMFKLGCPWSIGPTPTAPGVRGRCRSWGDQVTERILELHPDAVLTTGTRPRPSSPGDYIPPRYPVRWRTVTAAGIPMVLLRDVPWLPENVPACVEAHTGDLVTDTARACGALRSQVLSADPVGDYPGGLPAGLSWIDLTPVICPEDTCLAIVGDVIVYSDSHHLTITFARSLTGRLERELGRATGWWPA